MSLDCNLSKYELGKWGVTPDLSCYRKAPKALQVKLEPLIPTYSYVSVTFLLYLFFFVLQGQPNTTVRCSGARDSRIGLSPGARTLTQ